MSQPIHLQLAEASHHNQRLSSDHYLDHILPEHWDILRDEASQIMAQLQSLYATFTPNSNNEAQTEENWIKPVLRVIGHIFEVQPPLKVPDGIQRPDYIFYRDDASLVANKNKIVNADDLQHGALAVGDAKSWDRSLDKALRNNAKGNDPFNNKNPSFQISFYMLQYAAKWVTLGHPHQRAEVAALPNSNSSQVRSLL